MGLISGRRRGWATPLVLAGLVAALADLPWIVGKLTGRAERWPEWTTALLQPPLVIAGNVIALVLAIWGIVALVTRTSPERRMATRLAHRGDHLGAGEIHLRAGDRKRALPLFEKARAWTKAAQVAKDLGQYSRAAGLLRRAGGRHLAEAARIYQRCRNQDLARQSFHALAEWHVREGNFDEAIEAWLRAGEAVRAVKVARVALSQGRLPPSLAAFKSALRAATETRDFELLGGLYEAESGWSEAADAWRKAGDHVRAMENFRRAGMLEEAARQAELAGRPAEAARLRLQILRGLEDRRRQAALQDKSSPVALDLARRVEKLAENLVPAAAELEIQDELIDVLCSIGRGEQAVRLRLEHGDAAAAAEVARETQQWELAASLLDQQALWGEASDMYELAGKPADAARCAEAAGELERALQLYRGQGWATDAARCLALLNRLQEALTELHGEGLLSEAWDLLRSQPGPVPDIPEVILDMAAWIEEHSTTEEAIACLQRAVVGVGLQSHRLQPAVEMARLFHQAGNLGAAVSQVERILDFDYANEEARQLKKEIEDATRTLAPATTIPAAGESGATRTLELVAAAERRYEISTELGRGGMGVVFKARDSRLERDVAIKVLRTTSAEEASRLEQEAKAAATLNHPGIVTVYDFEAGFEGYFIAMEFVPGIGLDELVRNEPERVKSNLREIMVQVSDAVAFAHTHRVIHRDLKPGNILLTSANEVKILDFGIAARLGTSVSSSEGVCGTPYYMSPEQIRGEAPTPSSDIYSLGATFFHLATGRPPFQRGNVIQAHLEDSPPDPAELAEDLPPGIAPIILRCLAKDPEDRYPDAGSLRNELRGFPDAR